MPSRTHLAAPLLLLAAAAVAQTHHVAPPEKVTRAIAVYEWTGDLAKPTASRLVPVSLFINGHFEDAGLYLARPVPFALESGDLYSVEQAGDEKGTLSIEHARNYTTGRLLPDQEPVGAWYGFGRFAPLAPPKPPPALHASAHLPVIVSSSDSSKPHFGNKPAAPAEAAPSNPKDNTPKDSTGKDDTSTPAKPTPSDDADRPTLGRRRGTADDADTTKDSTASDPGGAAKDTDTERPSLRKRDPDKVGKKSPPEAGVTGPARPLNDDPDRPTIRRGKTPAQEEASELTGLPPDLHQVAAISDPKVRDPHLFARGWDSPAERADILARLQALARVQVAGYLAQNHLTPGVAAPASTPMSSTLPSPPPSPATADAGAPTLRRTPGGIDTSTMSTHPSGTSTTVPPTKPASSTTAARQASARPAGRTHAGTKTASAKSAPTPALIFTDEQLAGYTLSYGGLATYIYTAQIPVTVGGPVYVTLLAQRLPSGEFQVALHNVTDATHLDRTPWMRPIDAVDPDASHRASILIELRAQSSRQFALYRLIGAQAEQQFLSSPIQ